MSTLYLFKQAVKISQKFSQDNKVTVGNACRNIQNAQKELLLAAEKSPAGSPKRDFEQVPDCGRPSPANARAHGEETDRW